MAAPMAAAGGTVLGVNAHLDTIPTPFAVIDLDRAEKNCERMRAFAASRGVVLRPHVKTHKCVPAALLALGGEPGPITVSTLAEAIHFSEAGFDDITYAVPLAPSRMEQALALRERVRLSVLIDHPDAGDALAHRAREAGTRARVFVKVDCGYHRAGVEPHRPEARALVERVAASPSLELAGLLTHAGHSYACAGREAIARVAEEERRVIVAFADALRASGIAVPVVSVGSTPTMSVAPELTGVTEIRPGNYVLFDAFQAAIGSCALDDAAFSVVASVIGSYPHDGRLVLDAGGLALSKDPGATHVPGAAGYGVLASLEGAPLPDLALVSLSQEHGVVRGSEAGIRRLAVGDRLRIIANHSCLAAACHPHYEIARGTRVIDRWTPVRAW